MPHVYTVDIDDKDALREVITKALNASAQGMVRKQNIEYYFQK